MIEPNTHYDLYESGNREPDQDEQDWLRAEQDEQDWLRGQQETLTATTIKGRSSGPPVDGVSL
jgi:hypothetical protein